MTKKVYKIKMISRLKLIFETFKKLIFKENIELKLFLLLKNRLSKT